MADVVLYDRLVNSVLLQLAPRDCERVYAGKKHAGGAAPMTQDAICELLIARARAGKRVVRLKGGDPFVFGRGAEECRALAEAGVRYEVVPGVTAATAVCAYAGIPLTARQVSSTVALATGHEAAGKPKTDVDWAGLARAGTVVLFMAVKTAADCAQHLIDGGKDPATPAAAIYWGTTPSQRTLITTLGELGQRVRETGLKPPALLVIGDVVSEHLDWCERRPLFSRRVLVTRRMEQSVEFSQVLSELGAEAVCVPVTALAPPSDASEVSRAVSAIDDVDWFVFTSANAVDCFFDALLAAGRDARAFGPAKVACVGKATARALLARGIAADLVPARGNATGVAAAVIAANDSIAGARVMIPRAEGGLDDAVDALRAAGADVEPVAVYRTCVADPSEPAVAYGVELLAHGDIDICAFFAPSQVEAVFELVGDAAADQLSRCVIAAVGKTTAGALKARGVAADVVPTQPGAEPLARAIAEFIDNQED